jgi:hypothetical protein
VTASFRHNLHLKLHGRGKWWDYDEQPDVDGRIGQSPWDGLEAVIADLVRDLVETDRGSPSLAPPVDGIGIRR